MDISFAVSNYHMRSIHRRKASSRIPCRIRGTVPKSLANTDILLFLISFSRIRLPGVNDA